MLNSCRDWTSCCINSQYLLNSVWLQNVVWLKHTYPLLELAHRLVWLYVLLVKSIEPLALGPSFSRGKDVFWFNQCLRGIYCLKASVIEALVLTWWTHSLRTSPLLNNICHFRIWIQVPPCFQRKITRFSKIFLSSTVQQEFTYHQLKY